MGGARAPFFLPFSPFFFSIGTRQARAYVRSIGSETVPGPSFPFPPPSWEVDGRICVEGRRKIYGY